MNSLWRRGATAWVAACISMVAAPRLAPAEGLTARPDTVGAGRCSATACHGSPEPRGGSSVRHDEHTVWIGRDPHSHASETLTAPASRGIAARLSGSSRAPIPAHRDARCLACHSTPAPVAALADGVSCESCHGAAAGWLAPHTAYGWDALPLALKEGRFGMNATKDLARRAEVCAGCHVGAPRREVDHDLIAAGHPALKFEFAAYLANLPAHWVEKGRNAAPDLPARAWALGQVVSARSALELLGARAHSTRWPEFSEYECASCHRDLVGPVARDAGPGRTPGTPAWGTWYYPLTTILAGSQPGPDPIEPRLAALKSALERPTAEAGAVAEQARETSRALARWLHDLRDAPFDPPKVEALARAVLARGPTLAPGPDSDSQRYLSLVPLRQALERSPRTIPALPRAIFDLRARLGLPTEPIARAGQSASGTLPSLVENRRLGVE